MAEETELAMPPAPNPMTEEEKAALVKDYEARYTPPPPTLTLAEQLEMMKAGPVTPTDEWNKRVEKAEAEATPPEPEPPAEPQP